MPKPSLRDALVAAAVHEFQANGYAATGVAMISARAGAPKGSFYYYFSSKEALAQDALSQYGDSRRLEMLADDGSPARDRILAHFTYLREDLAQQHFAQGCLFGTFAAESGATEALGTMAAAGLRAWIDALTDAVARAQAEGSVAGAAEPRQLASLAVDLWEGAALRAKAARDGTAIDSALDVIMEQLLTAPVRERV
jgi:TetR/AcrR family transcriptional repressor of nem operon